MKNRVAHILIADDDPQILKLFTRLLKEGGYAVTAVSSGAAAIKVLRQEHIDLFVLDMSMPQPDGFEVLKSLRVKSPGLRILVVSGFMQGALLEASEFLGASASLNKADAPDLLLKTVKSLLQ